MLVSHIRHLMDEEGVTDFREAVERGARGAAGADPDDGDGGRAGADPAGARRRQAGQRDPDADGDRHPLGKLIVFCVPTLYLRYGRLKAAA